MNSETKRETSDANADAAAEGDESFFRRWSRRKREADVTRSSALPEATNAASESPEATSEKILTDADMPPIESLNEQSDFSVFLSAGVSEALRRRALRKLFTLPSINQRCPLDSEYYDCRNLESLGNVITHDMREEIERAAQKLKEAAASVLSDEAPKPSEGTDESKVAIDEHVPTSDPEPAARLESQRNADDY